MGMKSFIKNCLQYHLPGALTLFMLVTVERMVVTDGGYDRLYGLPFAYISNSYASSMSYDIYISTMLLDLFFYLALATAVFGVIGKMGIKLKTHWIITSLGVIISLFWIATFVLKTIDSSFYLVNHTEYKTINRGLIFGSRP
jgi:hypothetical protein